MSQISEQNPLNEPPKISVIVPCRNEEKFIKRCLDSIIESNYPRSRMEIFVVDGMSEDLTWRIIEEYSEKFNFLHGLRNPKKITPVALNLGIQHSTGEIIIRVDAHAALASDYLKLAAETLLISSADNVGGSMETMPSNQGIVAKAIAAAMSHPFGVGNSPFRISRRRAAWVDTVFGGCYRREVFDRIGLFNERLARGQDMEFNRRLVHAGGRILLEPRLRSTYYASPNLKSFWRHNVNDGEWAILPFAYSRVVPIRLRHAIPAVFVTTIPALALGGIWSPMVRKCFCGLILFYLILSLTSAAHIAWRERSPLLMLVMPIVLGVRHFAYGLGSLLGLVRLPGKFRFSRYLILRDYFPPS